MKQPKAPQSPLLREASESAGATLGQRLSRGRVARGLPIEEVARQMNLSASTIRALEADNHRGLPGRTFVRGYLRNYARIIGVPVEDLVQAYDAQFEIEEEPVTFLAPRRRALRWLGPVIIAVIAALFIALLWGAASLISTHWFTVAETAQSLAKPVINTVGASVETESVTVEASPAEPLASPVKGPTQETLVTPPESVPVVATQTDEAAEDMSASPAPMVSAPSVPAVVKTMPLTTSPVGAATSHAAPVPPQAPGAERPSVEAAEAPHGLTPPPAGRTVAGAGGRGALRLDFTADCWIRVRDASGSLLYRGMMRSGTSLSLEGAAPLKVVLGNRAAAKVTYNGEPVEVPQESSNPVTTLNLGAP